MLGPFHWKVLEYCAIVYIKELLKCISVFQHCRFSQDEGRGERDGGSEGASSCLWIIDFSIRRCDSPVLSPAPFEEGPTALKRYKDVGILARQIAVQSQTTVLWRWLTGRLYNTTCSHRTATAAGLTSLWLFFFCVFFFNCRLVGCSHGLLFFLVDPLEALRVLHSHEEFLSQVLEGVVSWQVQAVETGGEKYTISKPEHGVSFVWLYTTNYICYTSLCS